LIYHKGVVSQQAKQEKSVIKEVKIHDKHQEKNIGSSDADIDKRLSKWMRRD